MKSSNSRRGGSRPGAGRPKGARNRIAQELKEMLAPLDQMGVKRLEGIIRRGSEKHALEGIRLAWEYRHGRPKQQVEFEEEETIHPDCVVVIEGSKEEYIGAIRRAKERIGTAE